MKQRYTPGPEGILGKERKKKKTWTDSEDTNSTLPSTLHSSNYPESKTISNKS